MLQHFRWANPPAGAIARTDDSLTFAVTPRTDYWRQTHYGFTVDDGPFLYTRLGGDFALTARLSAGYRAQFDQLGLMVRTGPEHWVKAGVEYMEGVRHVSAVVTHGRSDWSMQPLGAEVPAGQDVRLRLTRRGDHVECAYALDVAGEALAYQVFRLAYLEPGVEVTAGLYAACPDGEGFEARFTEVQLAYLEDEARAAWRDGA